MKKTLIAVVAFFTLAAFSTGDPLKIGDAMPGGDIAMQDVSGTNITLQQAMGNNGLMVMFSCNTCPYVVKNQQRTVEICNFAKGKQIGVIVVNSNEGKREDDDSFTAMKDYYKTQQYNWFYTVDANNVVADAFGAKRTPECFLFNKEAKLVYHGAIDDNPADAGNVSRNHLQIAIEELVSGKDIAQKETRSVGCSIKRKG
jgi:hypothetical protein